MGTRVRLGHCLFGSDFSGWQERARWQVGKVGVQVWHNRGNRWAVGGGGDDVSQAWYSHRAISHCCPLDLSTANGSHQRHPGDDTSHQRPPGHRAGLGNDHCQHRHQLPGQLRDPTADLRVAVPILSPRRRREPLTLPFTSTQGQQEREREGGGGRGRLVERVP